MKVKVRCSYIIDIDVPDGVDPVFYVEENGCPGTGAMGAALQKLMDENETTCWACAAEGRCEVLGAEDMRGLAR